MKAVIIEDEHLAAVALGHVLADIAPDIEVQVRLDSVSSSVKWLKQNQVDLIFMDIHLGDGQSFDIFDQVEIRVPVIFITAYDEYALRAFKHQGVDYILKPIEREELQKALEKARAFIAAGKGNIPEGLRNDFQERFLVSVGTRMKSVLAGDIAYFMADGKYLMLFTHEGTRYILNQTIGTVEMRLNPALFFKINRKFIVSFSAIREMVKYSNSRIKVLLSPEPPDNIEAIVSGERVQQFKQWLNQ